MTHGRGRQVKMNHNNSQGNRGSQLDFEHLSRILIVLNYFSTKRCVRTSVLQLFRNQDLYFIFSDLRTWVGFPVRETIRYIKNT